MRFASLSLVLVSAVAHALLSLFIKKSNDKQVFCWLYHSAAVIVFAPIPIFYLVTEPAAFPSLSPMLVVVGLLHYGYIFTFAKALHGGDISLVYPIIRSSPALVLVGSIVFLGEEVSFLGGTGVLVTVLGVYILCMNRGRITANGTAVQMAIVTAFTATAFTLIDKLFVSTVPPVLYAYLLYVMITIGLSAQMVVSRSLSEIGAELRHSFHPMIFCAVLDVAGYLLVLIAFADDKVSYVVGMRQISIVIAVAMGGVLLREDNFRQRAIASCVIFLGVMLISFAK